MPVYDINYVRLKQIQKRKHDICSMNLVLVTIDSIDGEDE